MAVWSAVLVFALMRGQCVCDYLAIVFDWSVMGWLLPGQPVSPSYVGVYSGMPGHVLALSCRQLWPCGQH